MSASSPEPTPSPDLEPRRRLRRMRTVATALLVAMAAVLIGVSWLLIPFLDRGPEGTGRWTRGFTLFGWLALVMMASLTVMAFMAKGP